MRLASDSIVIHHGDLAVELRPSLRAAYRLNRRFGMGKLFHAVNDGNLNIILDIIAENDDPAGARAIALLKVQTHLGNALAELQEPLFAFLAASFGIDNDPETVHPAEAREKAGKPFDLEAALTDIFEIATGWLGWSPSDAWSATPAEIIAAQRGLVAKLKAIHGTAQDKPEYDPLETVSPQKAKEGIATLRTLANQTRP